MPDITILNILLVADFALVCTFIISSWGYLKARSKKYYMFRDQTDAVIVLITGEEIPLAWVYSLGVSTILSLFSVVMTLIFVFTS